MNLTIFDFLNNRFFSLLSSLLEEKFGKSENENIRNLIQDQFQGEIKYTTTCKNCQNASSRNCFFNSLELSIKGNSTLEECILEYTKDEHLSGADQYPFPFFIIQTLFP